MDIESTIPKLPPGATRKRNVLDVLDELDKARSSSSSSNETDADAGAKTILVRVDFNVPMDSSTGRITDDSRIRGALPTIQAIVRAKHNAVLVSHMGRPKLVQKYVAVWLGESGGGGALCPASSSSLFVRRRLNNARRSVSFYVLVASTRGEDNEETRKQRHELSLAPVAAHLAELLQTPVMFGEDCVKAHDAVGQLPREGGGVCLLENLRFYKAEEKNEPGFAKTLAEYADAYVNDAFGTCHRAHASVSGVPTLLPPKLCGIGCLVASELAFLDFKSVSDGGERIAAIIGGSKVSTKLPVIQGLMASVHVLVLGGGLAFTFLKAMGVSIGDSLVEEGMVETARQLMEQAERDGKRIVVPVDNVCAQSFPKGAMDKADTRTFDVSTPGEGIEDGWMGLDAGPKTLALLQEELAGTTKIVMNGPLGVFEVPPFDEGTRGLVAILKDLTAHHGCVTVVGGGDSVAALEAFGETAAVAYVSTGGGATLELLAGDILPGVAAIADYVE
jgi:phosphoglycerate kinase